MYLKRTLSQNEKIIKVVNLHIFTYFVPAILFVIALIIILKNYFYLFDFYGGIIGNFFGTLFWGYIFLIISIIMFLKKYLTEMVITDRRVVIKTGILSATTDELKLEKIESISVKKTLFGMIFNYGTIYFSGTGTTKVKFDFVSNPILSKKNIEDTIEVYQKKLVQNN